MTARSLTVNYTYFSTSNSHNWPTWSAGQEYTFVISVTNIGGEMDGNHLFVTMAYSWFVSTQYNANSAQCDGCMCSWTNCQQPTAVDGSASRYCSQYMCANGYNYMDGNSNMVYVPPQYCCNYPYFTNKIC